MPVIQNVGSIAGVGWEKYSEQMDQGEPYAFWVCGDKSRTTTLSSTSFASCVGLVLYGDVDGRGAVAHFWNPAGLAEAKQIVDAYMAWLLRETGGYCGDDVQAVVFGGKSLESRTGEEFTKPRIGAIADWLEQRWDMSVTRVDRGSSSVELRLDGDGGLDQRVKLSFGLLSTRQQDRHESALSKAHSSMSPGKTRNNRSGSQ